MDSNERGDIGEAFVNNIAYNTFIKYWCYPNPKDELGDKKEICDLLILFNDIAIIISVKNYEFKNNYERYFRSTTDKALRQLYGAERKLFGNNPTYIKHPNKTLELFAKTTFQKVYRIIVNLGEGLKFYHPSHYTQDNKHVTIMEKATWNGILQEMDTIVDLTKYLDARDDLFKNRSVLMLPGDENDWPQDVAKQFMEYMTKPGNDTPNQAIISGTENDLLARYITSQNNFPEKLKSKQYNGFLLQIDGEWDRFIKRPEVKQKKEKDQISYFVDEFVERELLKIKNGEIVAKHLMSLSRFERRIFTNGFFEFCRKYEPLQTGSLFARSYHELAERAFIFVFYPINMSQEEVNTLCSIALDSFALFNKFNVKDYILIGTTANMEQFKFGYNRIDQPMTKEEQEDVMYNAELLGWFKNIERGEKTDTEY